MKRNRIIAALAVIAVFTAASCVPEVAVSEYDWENANVRDKPQNGGSVKLPELAIPISTNVNPQINITFPGQADVLRAADVEKSLKSFLKFHNFYDHLSAGDDWMDAGYTSSLSDEIHYQFIMISGTTITVELQEDFSIRATPYSNLIAAFNGQKYTYSKGLMMDVDGNGTGGEEVYDDLYIEIDLPGADIFELTWVPPGNREWKLIIDNSDLRDSVSWLDAASAVSENMEYVTAARIVLNGINPGTDAGKLTFKTAAGQFAGNFKLQRFSGNAWIDAGTALYDESISVDTFLFKDVTVNNEALYRIKWSGFANRATTGKYFGVQQRIIIEGDIPESSSIMDSYKWTEAYSNIIHFYNPDLFEEITAAPARDIYSIDNFNKNIIFRFEFPVLGAGVSGDEYAGLAALPVSDFKGDNACFKLIYNYDGVSDFKTDEYYTIKIDSVRYAAEGILPDGSPNTSLNNALYVTLAPEQRIKAVNLLINNKFTYTGSSPKRVFGDSTNRFYNNYRFYDTANSLVNNIWTDGEIDGNEIRYYINVKAGSYYRIYWNDSWSGDSTKNGDIYVSASYFDMTPIFILEDSGYNTPRAFTAREDTIVMLLITQYAAGGFGIAYTVNSDIRP